MNRQMKFISWSLIALAMLVGLGLSAPVAQAVTGAGFTTVNEGIDGTGHCKNGNPAVNCNIYDGKQYVWLNGGPSVAYVGDGAYFFAVLVPGGQADPNDGAAKNLSDDFDAYTNRSFSVSGGIVSYSGTHDFNANKIRLMPYADTTNPGGVYIMAICSLANGYPVDPSKCKYDAFKIKTSETPPPADLVVTKDVTTSFKRTYTWNITKSVDKTLVKQVGGSAVFNYTVGVAQTGLTDSNWAIAGVITVFNPNDFDVTGVNVTDAVSGVGACAVTSGTNLTVPANDSVQVQYGCAMPNGASRTNTATATWLDFGSPNTSASFSIDFKFTTPTTTVNKSITVTDTFNSVTTTLGTLTATDAQPFASATYKYSRTIAVPRFGCLAYPNTAKITETGQTASASVTVCGPIKTGALTMGFWQNNNGQEIIKTGASTSGVCNSGTWLRQFAPFQDLSATATCNQVATYVYNLIKAANASGASMNAMLKAQMLATALDVYFSNPALGGNKINAPAPIGGVAIDLTKVCANPGTCSLYVNVSGAFGGASSLTVAQMLTFAASQSNAGGSVWYGQVKATQELAKDAFDAINNQVVFAP
jgi:hypothetical protein